MDENIFKRRREEIERTMVGLQEQMTALGAELRDVRIAERVWNRLNGIEEAPVKDENDEEANADPGLTVRQMILGALKDNKARGRPVMTPQEIREEVARLYGVTVGQQINTNLHRMMNKLDEVTREESSGAYYLSLQKFPDEGSEKKVSSGNLWD